MSREKGTVSFSANFEAQKAAPIDARMLASSVDDLILDATWTANDGSIYSYAGMVVSVIGDGVYRLNSLPHTTAENWEKLGAGGSSSSSGLNYSPDSDLTTSADGWTSTDGANFLLSRNTTTPITEICDGLIAKVSGDFSAEKNYTPITIELGQRSRNIEFFFEYKTDATYEDDFAFVKIYDVTNAAYVSSNPTFIKASDGARFYGVFQAASDSVSYQLEIWPSADTTAWTMNIGRVVTTRPMQNLVVDNRGKQYDLTSILSCSVAITDVAQAVGYIYLTKDLKWRMAFNISHSVASGTRSGVVLTISGVVFSSLTQQTIDVMTNGGIATVHYTNAGTGGITVAHASGTSS